MRAVFAVAISMGVMGAAQAQVKALRHDAMVHSTFRVEKSIRYVFGMEATKMSPGLGRDATRNEMVASLYNIFKLVKPHFRGKPVGIPMRRSIIDQRNSDPKTREMLYEMAEWGFVASVGPIVTGANTLTPKEYGEALGLFLNRLADLTYQWESKYSPSNLPTDDPQ